MNRPISYLLILCFLCFSVAVDANKKKKKTRPSAKPRNLSEVVRSFNRSKNFPLKVSKNGRYLVNQYGEAFLLNADAGWSLFQKVRLEQAENYILSRKNKFFNTIFLQLLPKEPADKNIYNESPFLHQGDFAEPNEKYFLYVEQILNFALAHQMLVCMNPAWLGCCKENWAEAQYNNGPEKCRSYGQYLAQRFKKFNNLVWIMGGDRDPLRETAVVRAMSEGLRAESPHQLLTYHAASSHSSTDVFPSEYWLNFSMLHTYFRGKQNEWTVEMPQVYEAAQAEWKRESPKPFILGESQYEGVGVGNSHYIRRQAYWTLLSGGAGQCYGSSASSFKDGWENKLNLEGVTDIAHFYTTMSSLPWELLRPDLNNDILVEGQGIYGADDYVSVAKLSNNRLTLMYLPVGRPLKINMEKMSGSSFKAVWINPRDNKRWAGGFYKPKGIRELTPPTLREDWLLLIGNVGKK